MKFDQFWVTLKLLLSLISILPDPYPVVNDPVNFRYNDGDWHFASSTTNPDKLVNNLPIFLKVRVSVESFYNF